MYPLMSTWRVEANGGVNREKSITGDNSGLCARSIFKTCQVMYICKCDKE
jgi:hypothetical protein